MERHSLITIVVRDVVDSGQPQLLPRPTQAFPPAALCPNPPPTKKITEDDVKVMLYLLEEVGTAFLTQTSPPFNCPTGLRAFVCFLLA